MLSKLIVRYDTARYPFAMLMADHLGVENLSLLHETYDFPLLTRENDQAMELHRRMYEIGGAFFETYHRFLRDHVMDMIGEAIVYQKKPNFRVQMASNVAVGAFHRDRDTNHSPNEINFWIPLTRVTESTAVWIESADGRGDFRPAVMDYGQMLVFDGANLQHGNQINHSPVTRVSLDFRVIPASLYQEDPALETINKKMKMVIGEYYERMSLRPAATEAELPVMSPEPA